MTKYTFGDCFKDMARTLGVILFLDVDVLMVEHDDRHAQIRMQSFTPSPIVALLSLLIEAIRTGQDHAILQDVLGEAYDALKQMVVNQQQAKRLV